MIVRKRYTWDPKDKYGPIASTGPITAFTVKNPSYNPLYQKDLIIMAIIARIHFLETE